jgi:hypothetical protein
VDKLFSRLVHAHLRRARFLRTSEDSKIRSSGAYALTITCKLFPILAPLQLMSFHFPPPTKHGRSIPTPSLNQIKGVQTAERQRHERLVHPSHSNALFHVRITQHHSRFQDTQKAWFRRDQNRAEVGVVSMSCWSINYMFTSCSGCASCYDAIIWMRAWANEQGDVAALRKDQIVAHSSRLDKAKAGAVEVADEVVIGGTMFPIFFGTLAQKW